VQFLRSEALRSSSSSSRTRQIKECKIIDCARGCILLRLTTDGHKASRGLSATTELLVTVTYYDIMTLLAKAESLRDGDVLLFVCWSVRSFVRTSVACEIYEVVR